MIPPAIAWAAFTISDKVSAHMQRTADVSQWATSRIVLRTQEEKSATHFLSHILEMNKLQGVWLAEAESGNIY